MIILGIDPGVVGGIALLHDNGSMNVFAMPDSYERLSQLFVDWFALDDPVIGGIPVKAYIEKQWIWKDEKNLKTANKLVCGFCTIKGIMIGLGIPFEEVPSRTWKKLVLGSANANKQRAINFISQKYNLEGLSDGEADAACLAVYGTLQKE